MRNSRHPDFIQIQEEIPEIMFDLKSGSAIDLIKYNRANQKFELDQKAADVILAVEGNAGFIFNIGEPKIGKSYLLNGAMDLDRGFAEKDRGVRMWTKPFYREEENLHLFFVDIQGFDMDDKFANFVWLLSFLVGTIVIYSSSGEISDKTYEGLKPLEFVAKTLRISSDNVENDYMMSYYAPKLVWLLKDFRPIEDANGKPMQADKYLGSSLLEKSTNQRATSIKKFLTTIMKEQTCVTFNGYTKSDPSFIQGTKILKEKIYSRSFAKNFDGISFNSRMLVNFITGFIELYNADKFIEYYDL